MVNTPENKSESRLPWGMGRIAFTAQRERIEAMLSQGYPKTMIYSELEPHLNGLSYTQFNTLIRKKIGGSIPRQSNKSVIPQENREEKAHEENSNDKPISTTKKYQPGPRIPNPSELY